MAPVEEVQPYLLFYLRRAYQALKSERNILCYTESPCLICVPYDLGSKPPTNIDVYADTSMAAPGYTLLKKCLRMIHIGNNTRVAVAPGTTNMLSGGATVAVVP